MESVDALHELTIPNGALPEGESEVLQVSFPASLGARCLAFRDNATGTKDVPYQLLSSVITQIEIYQGVSQVAKYEYLIIV